MEFWRNFLKLLIVILLALGLGWAGALLLKDKAAEETGPAKEPFKETRSIQTESDLTEVAAKPVPQAPVPPTTEDVQAPNTPAPSETVVSIKEETQESPPTTQTPQSPPTTEKDKVAAQAEAQPEQTAAKAEPAQKPRPVKTPPVQTDKAKLKRIEELLSGAAANYKARHYTTPQANNAWDKYRQVLELDPDNKAAKKGLKRIVDKYLRLAQTSIRQKDWTLAIRFVERASHVIPDDPRLPAIRKKIEEKRKAAK